tara:strand:+ start:74249 stop:74746 length:498 start_codon:yes stop_codon:yes gene_type:complete
MNFDKKKKIRTLFIVLLLFLPLQYGYVGIVGELYSEPWPSFLFPGFKNVYSTDDSFEIDQHLFRFYSDDLSTLKEVRPQELFPELPLSQIPGFMRTHFQEPSSIENFSNEAVLWLFNLIEKYSGENVNQIEIVLRKNRFKKGSDGMIFDSVIHEEFIAISKPENE